MRCRGAGQPRWHSPGAVKMEVPQTRLLLANASGRDDLFAVSADNCHPIRRGPSGGSSIRRAEHLDPEEPSAVLNSLPQSRNSAPPQIRPEEGTHRQAAPAGSGWRPAPVRTPSSRADRAEPSDAAKHGGSPPQYPGSTLRFRSIPLLVSSHGLAEPGQRRRRQQRTWHSIPSQPGPMASRGPSRGRLKLPCT